MAVLVACAKCGRPCGGAEDGEEYLCLACVVQTERQERHTCSCVECACRQPVSRPGRCSMCAGACPPALDEEDEWEDE